MEGDDLLQDHLISHKESHGSHSKFDVFFEKLLEVLSVELVPDSRRSGSTMYSYHFSSLASTTDEVVLLLLSDALTPTEKWLAL